MIISGSFWRRLISTFATSFMVLTAFLSLPPLTRQTLPASMLVRVAVLSLPFIVSLTLPMAILIAVLRVFAGRPGDNELLAAQVRGVTPTRLVAPVVAVAGCVACLAFLWNDAVLPRSNHRLRGLLLQIQYPQIAIRDDGSKGDREMTIGELRTVVRTATDDANQAAVAGDQRLERSGRQRAATYEVEIQKKYAIAAACVVFAFFGAAVGLRIPGGGWMLTIAVSMVVFGMQYVALIGGEELADRLVISPFVAMWTVNLLLAIGGAAILWSVKPPHAGLGSGHGDPQAV